MCAPRGLWVLWFVTVTCDSLSSKGAYVLVENSASRYDVPECHHDNLKTAPGPNSAHMDRPKCHL
eukprot:6472400-Amphidinium_carterae.1